MGYLGIAVGSPSAIFSYELESSDDVPATLGVYWWGGPGAAQASLTHFNNSTGASAWVYEANGRYGYFKPAVYLEDMKHVTFAVVSGYSAGDGGDNWVTALLNILVFPAGTPMSETK